MRSCFYLRFTRLSWVLLVLPPGIVSLSDKCLEFCRSQDKHGGAKAFPVDCGGSDIRASGRCGPKCVSHCDGADDCNSSGNLGCPGSPPHPEDSSPPPASKEEEEYSNIFVIIVVVTALVLLLICLGLCCYLSYRERGHGLGWMGGVGHIMC